MIWKIYVFSLMSYQTKISLYYFSIFQIPLPCFELSLFVKAKARVIERGIGFFISKKLHFF